MNVRFTRAVRGTVVRAVEYRGLDLAAPFDAAAGSAGSGSPSNAGALAAKAAGGLVVAGNFTQGRTLGPGAEYTAARAHALHR